MRKIRDFFDDLRLLLRWYTFDLLADFKDKIIYHYSVNVVSWIVGEIFWTLETRTSFFRKIFRKK